MAETKEQKQESKVEIEMKFTGRSISTTIQEMGQSNKTNLCDTCKYNFATCSPKFIIFGDRVGFDNVCSCDGFSHQEVSEKLQITNEKYSRMIDRLDELWENGELKFDQYFYLVGGKYDG